MHTYFQAKHLLVFLFVIALTGWFPVTVGSQAPILPEQSISSNASAGKGGLRANTTNAEGKGATVPNRQAKSLKKNGRSMGAVPLSGTQFPYQITIITE